MPIPGDKAKRKKPEHQLWIDSCAAAQAAIEELIALQQEYQGGVERIGPGGALFGLRSNYIIITFFDRSVSRRRRPLYRRVAIEAAKIRPAGNTYDEMSERQQESHL
jgi:hypothetical protein